MLHDPLARPSRRPTRRTAGWNGRRSLHPRRRLPGGWYRSGQYHRRGDGRLPARPRLRADVVLAERLRQELQRPDRGRDRDDDRRNGSSSTTAGRSTPSASVARAARTRPIRSPTTTRASSTGSSSAARSRTSGSATVTFITTPGCWTRISRAGRRSVDPGAEASGRPASRRTRPCRYGGQRADGSIRARNCDIVPVGRRYDPRRTRGGVAAMSTTTRSTPTALIRRPGSPGGRWTTWASSTGCGVLQSGVITPEQFLDLNERVGGFDADANLVPARTVADPRGDARGVPDRAADQRRGRAGRRTDHRLSRVLRRQSYGDIHVRYHTFSMRARLEKANGTSANHVSLLEDAQYGLFSTASPLLQHAVDSLDEWLTDLAADDSSRPRIDKIVARAPVHPGRRAAERRKDSLPNRSIATRRPAASSCSRPRRSRARSPAPGGR